MLEITIPPITTHKWNCPTSVRHKILREVHIIIISLLAIAKLSIATGICNLAVCEGESNLKLGRRDEYNFHCNNSLAPIHHCV